MALGTLDRLSDAAGRHLHRHGHDESDPDGRPNPRTGELVVPAEICRDTPAVLAS